MYRPTAFLLALAVVPVQRATASLQNDPRLPDATAPDGERGFGVGVDPRELGKALGKPVPDDQEFLDGLWNLARDVEVLAAIAARRYEQLGYFDLVDDRSAALRLDVDALHTGYRQYERRAMKIALGEKRGLSLARAMADAHFLARMKVLMYTEYDILQLRRALALLVVHAKGRAELEGGSELDELTLRADLAAARLRAARLDLETLYQPAILERRSDEVNVLQLARALARGGGEGGAALLKGVRTEARDTERDLLADGHLADFDADHTALLDSRVRKTRIAIRGFTEMLTILPLEPDGTLPSGLEGKNSDRYRQAADTGLEAARNDPLIAEVQYMLGLSFDFFAGRELSLPRFDRFLALRGIRHWEHRTFQGRALNDQEKWALWVVVGWMPPKDG